MSDKKDVTAFSYKNQMHKEILNNVVSDFVQRELRFSCES